MFGDRRIKGRQSSVSVGHRSGAGSRAREELPETRRKPKSHSRFEDAHLEHLGRVSSHLILLRLHRHVSVISGPRQGPTYRQVLHPFLVGLEVTTRFLLISCHFEYTTRTASPTGAMTAVCQALCGAWLSNQCTMIAGKVLLGEYLIACHFSGSLARATRRRKMILLSKFFAATCSASRDSRFSRCSVVYSKVLLPSSLGFSKD